MTTTWIDTDDVLAAADTIARETAWHGRQPDLFPPSAGVMSCAALDNGGGLDTLLAAVRDMPRRYSEQLDAAARAILQVVIDVRYADNPPVIDGGGVAP